jgi:glycosyltransferase involved in cell wall biosynthesis
MKMLIVVHAYAPSIGGSEYYAQQVAEHFVSDFGDEVTVFTTVADDIVYFGRGGDAFPPGIEVKNGVTVHRLPVFYYGGRVRYKIAKLAYRLHLPGNDYWRTLAEGPIVPGLARRIAASGANVVFATSFPLRHMYDALAGAQQGKIPIVYSGAIHPTDLWGYDRPMIYRAIRQADHYAAYTTFERDLVIAKGANSAKVSVTGAGVDIDLFANANGADMRRQLGLGDDPTILVIAKHSSRKRLDLMLDAMRYVWEAIPNARLLLAGGRSAYTPTLEAMIATIPTAWWSRITLINDFAEADKPALLAASNLLALPSSIESFGIVLLEAWATAKPVVGVDQGAVATLIDNGVDGLHFNYPHPQSLAEACITLLTQPDTAARMGQAGLEKVRTRYTWKEITKRLHALMQQITRNI